MSYTVKIQQFEGPFDLLLFFIERDELDINDIPIAKITNDFLEYIRHLEKLNVDVASEFILMAATLMRIKAKMLIPRKPLDEEGQEIDPRLELVERLLEYKRYKSVLDELREMEEDQAGKFGRGNVNQELRQMATRALVDVELESLTLFKLLKAFEQMMARFNAEKTVVHRIARYEYTIQDQQEFILSSVRIGKRASFQDIFDQCTNRIHAIVTFLALLELVNQQMVHITIREGYNNFWLEPREPDEAGPEDLPVTDSRSDSEEE